MAPQNDVGQLLAAWRALDGEASLSGWRTIPIANQAGYALRAGRRFPGNEESLMIGIDKIAMPTSEQLPQGQGFLVGLAELTGDGKPVWLTLSRQHGANIGFFTLMAADVIGVLHGSDTHESKRLVALVLARVKAWQEFMRRSGDGVLYPEAEVGLFGELSVIRSILDVGIDPNLAIEWWVGPLDGLQDFAIGNGAIEVKTTASPAGFVARIGSLDQLDDALIRPLYVAAVRLSQNADGQTLSGQVGLVRDCLGGHTNARTLFEDRLLHAGYLDASEARYTRRFSVSDVKFLLMDDSSPRLTRRNVVSEVRSARYELDLESIPTAEVAINDVLTILGVA